MKTKTTILTLAMATLIALSVHAQDEVVSRAYNFSCRFDVGIGESQGVGGLIAGEKGNKNDCDSNGRIAYVVRALGPTLTDAGITGVVSDPALTFYDGDGNVIFHQDSYLENSLDDNVRIDLAGLTPAYPCECAVIVDLMPGSYTSAVSGTGLCILEVYKLPR